MREAYLVNNSQSIVSVPLFEKIPVEIHGRIVQKVQFKDLVPTEEFSVGTDISVAKKKYYSQFKPVMVDLRFRDVISVKEEPAPAEQKEPETSTEDVVSPVEGEQVVDTEVAEVYDEAGLMKKRQAELIEIAAKFGIEASTQDSKAEITKMILEKQNLG